MKDFKTLVYAYLNGSLTIEDEKRLLEWIRSDESHYQSFVQWKTEWQASYQPSVDTQAAWERLLRRTKDECTMYEVVKPRPLRYWYRVAASLLLLIGLTTGLYLFLRPVQTTDPMMVTLTATQPTLYVLPDSTKVYLNSGSQLTYDNQYGIDTRSVALTGEAYFEVTKDPEHPFVVETEAMDITVLGTHFNVTAYADNSTYRTALLEGAVRVSNDFFTAELTPNEQLAYSPATGTVTQSPCDAEAAIAWIEGRMDYDGISMEELMNRLSRLYNKQITIAEDKKMQEVHFVMGDTLPLHDIMDAFARTYHLHVERTAEGYSIE